MQRWSLLLGTQVLLAGCGEVKDDTAPDDTGEFVDADLDGYGQQVDCDDRDPAVHPGATENCDGVDNDCDGLVDDEDDSLDPGSTSTWYLDGDDDGYGDLSEAVDACAPAEQYVEDASDCDDGDAGVHPAAVESCDLIDNDCDGDIDEGCVSAPWGTFDLDEGVATIIGREGSYSGWALDFAGDVNNDGYDDLVIGAYPEERDGLHSGAAYLVHGPVSGELDLSKQYAARLAGPSGEYWAGYSVAGRADLNSDGYDDLLVGSLGYTYLLHGPVSGDLELSMADAIIADWDASSGDLPLNIAAVGDVDGDGWQDVLLGDPYADYHDGDTPDAGAAYLLLGPFSGDEDSSDAEVRLHGEAWIGLAGQSVAGAGDVDGDGSGDLLIGTFGQGLMWLVSGAQRGNLLLTDVGLRLYSDGDFNGQAMTGLGDVDDDGYADLLIGAPADDGNGDDSGAAFLVLGPIVDDTAMESAHAVFRGGEAGDGAGYTVASAGDVDADGWLDVLVSAFGAGSNGFQSGAVHVGYGPFTGTTDLTSTGAKLSGLTEGDQAGTGLAGGGDTNGDGYADILVGSPYNDDGGVDAGASYLFLGGPGSLP